MIGRISEAAKYMVYNTINTNIPVRETARTRSAVDRVESGSLAVGAAPLASLFLSLVIAMFLVEEPVASGERRATGIAQSRSGYRRFRGR